MTFARESLRTLVFCRRKKTFLQSTEGSLNDLLLQVVSEDVSLMLTGTKVKVKDSSTGLFRLESNAAQPSTKIHLSWI